MITLRPGHERGRTALDWLDSSHSFSFADYFDPGHMGFRALRVLNDDRFAPGSGFGTHPHRDMEILTLVLSGALEHRDSLGNGSVIRPGEVQRMTAGTGIRHSEHNPSTTEPVHLLQVWIVPEQGGLRPGYEQRSFPEAGRHNRLQLVASRDGRDGSVRLHQDVDLLRTRLDPGGRVAHTLRPGRHAWVQVAAGAVTLNGHALRAGDGGAVSGEPSLEVVGNEGAELLVFDLA
jgi:redox-sensitive bicupin YhaK (pirin superfamily)